MENVLGPIHANQEHTDICPSPTQIASGSPPSPGFQLRDYSLRIETDGFGDVEKFDNIDTTLAAFQPRDKRLILTERIGKFCLGQARSLALFNQ